jgi:apolipoprotein N-acyltransferase
MALPVHFTYLAVETFYTRHGDLFAWLCTALAGVMVLVAMLSFRAQRGISP